MFRYPITMDANLDYQKSTFKPCNLFNKSVKSAVDKKYQSNIFLLVHNSNNEFVESYVSDNDVLKDIHEALKELSTQLFGLHFGLKTDLIRH